MDLITFRPRCHDQFDYQIGGFVGKRNSDQLGMISSAIMLVEYRAFCSQD